MWWSSYTTPLDSASHELALYRVTRHGQPVMTAAIALHDHDFPNNYMLAA